MDTILTQGDIYKTLKGLGEKLSNLIEAAELQGSGWVFDYSCT